MNPDLPPALPAPYVAQQPAETDPFVNRVSELQFLSEWAADRASGSVLTLLGIGGVGKTSLAWEWFAHYSDQGASFDGRMWWSFYEESESRFFASCSSYLTGITKENVPARGLVENIVRRLQEGRFLIVLDGFERQLVEYSLPTHFDPTGLVTSHRTRRAASPHVAEFIRYCATVRSGSKVLLTSRLAPADLENTDGSPVFGTQVLQLSGFDRNSTREFLSRLTIVDHIDELIELAAESDYHPLLVSMLAHQMANDPTLLIHLKSELQSTGSSGLLQKRLFILRGAIDRLGFSELAVAKLLATFREPVTYSTLVTRLVGEGKQFGRESELDRSLSRLQDLGLMAWNRRDNNYSLHPVVRAVILDMVNAAITNEREP